MTFSSKPGGGAASRNEMPTLAGSSPGKGLRSRIRSNSACVRTMTWIFLPMRSSSAPSRSFFTLLSASLLSKSTLPLWMYVRTDANPRPSQRAARSFMGRRPVPPTLIPRSRAMYFNGVLLGVETVFLAEVRGCSIRKTATAVYVTKDRLKKTTAAGGRLLCGAKLALLRGGRGRLLRRRRRLGLGLLLLFAGCENGVQGGAFHSRHELANAGVADVLDEAVDDVVAEVEVRHLAAAQAQAGLHLVAFGEEAHGLVFLGLVVLLVHGDGELDFLDGDDLLLFAGGALALFLLVEEAAVILDAADGWDRGG